MEKLKGYVVYGGRPEWYTAVLVLENGFAPCSHLCSHQGFMHGDLWGRRQERQRAAAIAGFEVDLQPKCYTEDELEAAVPGIMEKHKDEASYKAMSDAFTAALVDKSPHPEISIVVEETSHGS